MATMREYSWDNLKFVMMIGIVVEHSLLIYGYVRELELIWALCISWLMPLFTLISGYWYKARSLEFLCNRFIYPVILFSAINFIIGYLFYPEYRSGVQLIGYSMWYLWALFVFSCLMRILCRYFSLKTILCISFSVIIAYLSLPSLGKVTSFINIFSINRIIGFFPFFILGQILKQSDIKVRFYQNRVLYLLLPIVIITYVYGCYKLQGLTYSSGFYLMPGQSLNSILGFIFNYICITAISVILILIVPDKEYKFTKYGSRTLNVYLLHMAIVFPISWGLFSHLEFTLLNALLNVAVTSLLCGLFYTDCIDFYMTCVMKRRYWKLSFLLYILSVALVNKQLLYTL